MLTETKPTYILLPDPQMRQILFERSLEMVEAARDCDSVIFLDKGARPFSYLLAKLYPLLYPGDKAPDFKFLNIGKEKIYFLKAKQWLDHEEKYLDNPEWFPFLETVNDLIRVFGEGETEELLSVVDFKSIGKRIVVDDLVYRGESRALALKILRIVDPGSMHTFFPFLDTPERRFVFMNINFVPHMPWKITPVVSEPPTLTSFIAGPLTPYAKGVEEELYMLVEEGLSKL